MKKKLLYIIAVLCAAAMCAASFAACSGGKDNNDKDDGKGDTTIQPGDDEGNKDDDKDDDKDDEGDNEPEKPVYTEVLSDGGVIFKSKNQTTLSQNSGNGSVWVGNELVNTIWTLNISLNWGNYTTMLSQNSKVTSSDQNVIPAEAITYKGKTGSTSNALTGIDVQIDTTKINPGKTWLEMYFRSGNSSSKEGTICVELTVTEKQVIEVEKWEETVIFELDPDIFKSDDYDAEKLYFQFTDQDYATNMDSKRYQSFMPGDYEIKDNTVTLKIEYVKDHEYSVSVGINDGSGNSLLLNEYVGAYSSYDDGVLTFIQTGATVTIYVNAELWHA